MAKSGASRGNKGNINVNHIEKFGKYLTEKQMQPFCIVNNVIKAHLLLPISISIDLRRCKWRKNYWPAIVDVF